ncbi:MAG: hypothetical protein ACPG21_12195 [Crocinitomicaceae bacterium]
MKIKAINEIKFSKTNKEKQISIWEDISAIHTNKVKPLLHAKNKSVREMSVFLEEEIQDVLQRLSLIIKNEEVIDNGLKLTIKEIALLYALKNDSITRQVSDEIAKMFGHSSGEALYQNYSKKYQRKVDRIGLSGESNTLINNQIDRYEKVIPLLEEDLDISKANEEVAILKSYLSDSLN